MSETPPPIPLDRDLIAKLADLLLVCRRGGIPNPDVAAVLLHRLERAVYIALQRQAKTATVTA